MPKPLDLTNERFGKLVAIEKAPSRSGKTYWLCKCDCGTLKEIQTSHLTSKATQSCGCVTGKINENPTEKYEFCLNCGKPLTNRQRKYCNSSCQGEYQSKMKIEAWQNGEYDGLSGQYNLSKVIRKYLLEKKGYKCELCGWGEMNPFSGTIPLEVHHKDGDYKNNDEDNLQVLCPNCHSLTDSYKSLNKTGREDRDKYINRKHEAD